MFPVEISSKSQCKTVFHPQGLFVQISFAGCNMEFVFLLLVGTPSVMFNFTSHSSNCYRKDLGEGS